MSNVLMCDACGTVRSKTAARPEGWVSLRTLVALGHVVPETHPFHHERHLCSVECLQEFIQVAVDGGVLPVDADVVPLPERPRELAPAGTVAQPDAVAADREAPLVQGLSGHEDDEAGTAEPGIFDASASDSGPREPVGSPEVAPVRESEAPRESSESVVRLSDLIAQKLARGDGDRVDLREIAAKPAVKRRIK